MLRSCDLEKNVLSPFQQGVWFPKLDNMIVKGTNQIKNDSMATGDVTIVRSCYFDKIHQTPFQQDL